MAIEWIDDKKDYIAAAGWSTLSNLVAIKPDSELDIKSLKSLLSRVEKTIHKSPNRVRSAMNVFIIAIGSYVTALTNDALATAGKIGNVTVDVGDTACKVPDAGEYIKKVKDKGALGKKKKMARC